MAITRSYNDYHTTVNRIPRRLPADLVAQLASFFAADARDAIAAYLFGSYGRGQAGPASDVDIAVLFRQPPAPALVGGAMSIEGELERLVRRRVDLVVLNSAPADLVHRVLRDGVVFFDADPAARLRFEVARRNEYFDLAPLRERYRRTQPHSTGNGRLQKYPRARTSPR